MTTFNQRFGRRRTKPARQPPAGQHPNADFPVPQARPTQCIELDDRRLTIRTEWVPQRGWTWSQLDDRRTAMRQILQRAIVVLASSGIGLLLAAWVIPGVSLSVLGLIVAVLAFAIMRGIVSSSISKLPREYATLLLGGTGLALTIVALIAASLLTRGLTFDGVPSWLATTVVVWLVTTIGAITQPELPIRAGAGSTQQKARHLGMYVWSVQRLCTSCRSGTDEI